MAQHQHNMDQVPAAGELLPEGWYQFRVKEVDDSEEAKDSNGEQRCKLQLVVQQPDQYVGRTTFDNPSLDNEMGLGTLKAYYKAVNYRPGPEGHDPQNLRDGEFWAFVKHNEGKDGNTYANIAFWSIRSLQQGPGKDKGRK